MFTLVEKISAFILSLSLFLAPAGSYEAENSSDIRLNAAIISDIHLDATLPVGQQILTAGLKDMKGSKTPLDAVIVTGDLTNYGDENSLKRFYEILEAEKPAKNLIVAPGNHDIGHSEELTNAQARKMNIRYNNTYTGKDNSKIYYSEKVNDYTFIILADESKDNWDSCDISKKQIEFLDKELAKATRRGRPAFVICHWPLEGTNGQQTIYEDSGLDGKYAERVRKTLEKYENVFFISGHMHKGIDNNLMRSIYDFSSVETGNGVTYVNLPSFGSANRYGVPQNGYGMQLEVYRDEVVFRPRRYTTSQWYDDFVFRVAIK